MSRFAANEDREFLQQFGMDGNTLRELGMTIGDLRASMQQQVAFDRTKDLEELEPEIDFSLEAQDDMEMWDISDDQLSEERYFDLDDYMEKHGFDKKRKAKPTYQKKRDPTFGGVIDLFGDDIDNEHGDGNISPFNTYSSSKLFPSKPVISATSPPNPMGKNFHNSSQRKSFTPPIQRKSLTPPMQLEPFSIPISERRKSLELKSPEEPHIFVRPNYVREKKYKGPPIRTKELHPSAFKNYKKRPCGVASLFGETSETKIANSSSRKAPSFGGIANLFGSSQDIKADDDTPQVNKMASPPAEYLPAESSNMKPKKGRKRWRHCKKPSIVYRDPYRSKKSLVHDLFDDDDSFEGFCNSKPKKKEIRSLNLNPFQSQDDSDSLDSIIMMDDLDRDIQLADIVNPEYPSSVEDFFPIFRGHENNNDNNIHIAPIAAVQRRPHQDSVWVANDNENLVGLVTDSDDSDFSDYEINLVQPRGRSKPRPRFRPAPELRPPVAKERNVENDLKLNIIEFGGHGKIDETWAKRYKITLHNLENKPEFNEEVVKLYPDSAKFSGTNMCVRIDSSCILLVVDEKKGVPDMTNIRTGHDLISCFTWLCSKKCYEQAGIIVKSYLEKIDPKAIDALMLAGYMEKKKGNFEKSKEHYLELLKHHPHHFQAYERIYEVFLKLNEVDTYLDNLMEKINADKSTLPLTSPQIAYIYKQKKDVENQMHWLKIATRENPDNLICHWDLAKLCAKNVFKFSEAKDCYQKAHNLNIENKHVPELYVDFGKFLLQNRELKEAGILCDEGLAKNPGNVNLLELQQHLLNLSHPYANCEKLN